MVFALRRCAITPVLCDMEKYHYSRKWIRQCIFSMGIELSSVLGMIIVYYCTVIRLGVIKETGMAYHCKPIVQDGFQCSFVMASGLV